MKRRFFTLILALAVLLCAVPAAATETTEATEPTNVERAPGYCGEAIRWEFQDGTLTITGAGIMDDFPEGAPWEAHKEQIEQVIISGGITYVGAYSFCDYDNLKAVEFGRDVYEIGERAFFSCDGLTVIHLPASFKVFGPSSFMGCSKLTEFHCEGKFPSFRQNCLWDTYATIYYPADRPWGLEYINQLEEAFHGRIEFLASDGTDPNAPVESTGATEPATEEPTTVPPTTVPPATEAPTAASTEPVSEETESVTESTAGSTETPTEPEADEKSGGSKVPFIILGAVAAFWILGSLIFGGGKKRGKYSR